MIKEPETFFNYQTTYDLAVAAERELKEGGWKIVRLYKYSKRYWVVEYRK